MNNKVKMSFGVGLPSIIVIFVALCLTTLSALSLMTAMADRNLSLKTVSHEAAYYEARSQAQVWLSQVDAQLQKGEVPEVTTKEFPLSDQESLSVTIEIDGNRYLVVSQKLIITQQWNYDEYAPGFGDVIVE